MIKLQTLFALSGLLMLCNCKNPASEKTKSPVLWYNSPAFEWTEALPVGNGRIGGMLFGDPKIERLQVNEESLWGGSKICNDNPGALKHLPAIRRNILDGNIPKAYELAQKYIAGIPGELRSYQVLGDIYFQFADTTSPISNYRRALNLETGIQSVDYNKGDNSIHLELFSSALNNVMVLKMQCQKPGALNMRVWMERERDVKYFTENNALIGEGQVMDEDNPNLGPGGPHMKFYSKLMPLSSNGEIHADSNSLRFENGTEIVFLFNAATDYNIKGMHLDRSINPAEKCSSMLDTAAQLSYNSLKDAHISDHSAMFNRVCFTLKDTLQLDSLPTDERLKRFQQGADDPGLITTYFQYGRYLLMGSSHRPAQLPANLQGIWNKDMWAPWSSDYHVNINLQMNYWPAELCNLSETVEPLIDFMQEITVPGTATAKNVYGADGWTMHHTTDVFGKTSVISGVYWGMFPLGGAWMTFPLWRHFEYTNDTTYLRENCYPILKGSAKFLKTFLFEDDEGYLVTAPSYSPENSYINPVSGKEFKLTYAPSMDIQIIREVFKYTKQAAEILDADAEFIASLDETLVKLPPLRVGSDGTIMEWVKEFEEFEPGHRHISHLLGLHPGTQITPETPELYKAARKTLERRLANGGGHTGWSRAWIINFYARLHDGEASYHHLRALLEKSTLPNLFNTHPPFQIDGNFGGTAGIAEMLMQSHNGIIRLLPALPNVWPEGEIKGLKARGNFTVDMRWKNGCLEKVSILSVDGAPLKISYADKTVSMNTRPGELVVLDGDLKKI